MDVSTSSTDQDTSEKPCDNVNKETENSITEETNNDNGLDNEVISNEKSKDDVHNLAISALDDEDSVLGEVEPNKDYVGNIDEDELLKDTEDDERNKNLADSTADLLKHSEVDEINKNLADSTATTDLPDDNNGDDVDSTGDISGADKRDEEKNISASESLNNEDGVVDSSKENVVTGENHVSNSLELKEVENNETPDDEVSEKEDNKTETCDSQNTSQIERKLPVTETSVTSSHIESAVNDNDNSLHSSLNHELNNESSNSFLNEAENDSIDTSNKGEESNKETEEKLCDEPVESTACSADDENKNKKDDSCDGTKFLHIDQENSRPEESFEHMETGGEDPFAQTSDVAMDVSEQVEKGGELDKPEQSHSVTETMEVDEVTADSAANNEIQNEKTNDVANNETEVDSSEKSCVNLDGKEMEVDDTDTRSHGAHADSNEREIGKTTVNSELHHLLTSTDNTKVQVETNEKHMSETLATPAKHKLVRVSHKAKNRRISSSDDSSESDFDLDDIQSSKTRPKRNAAKKAESQIKVLSQIDEQMGEQEQADDDIEDTTVPERKDKPKPTRSVEDIPEDTPDNETLDIQTCHACKKVGPCKVNVLAYGKKNYFCDNDCFVTFRDGPSAKSGEGGEIVPPSTVMQQLKSADIQPLDRAEFIRKCSQCTSVVNGDDEKTLSWETMDFCSEECLGKYQQQLGSHCANCKGNVQPASLGKYCVRFGYEVKQFCCSTCLEEFKKGLKVCSFCQKDISSGAEGFLAPVGDKGTFKDFCTPACMEKYEQMSSNQPPPPQMHTCDVCNNNKLVEIEVFFDSKVNKLCSDICFTAYKFANKLNVDRCDMCRKYFDKDAVGEKFNIFYEGVPHNFCCKTCMNVYILAKRKIVPCNWCKVKKYNFDMIKRVQNTGQVLMMCSLNCLTLYQVSVNAVSSKRIKCDMCNSFAQAQYHLTMSDATIRNFCTYPCVMNFQQQYSKSPITLPGSDAPPIPTGAPKRVVPKNDLPGVPGPVIATVTSLANGQPTTVTTPSTNKQPSGKLNLVARLSEPPICRNKTTQTRPIMSTKSVSCRPHCNSVEVQTDDSFGKGVLPIPVPIYVPCPMAMYSFPFPVPVPFPLPIPVPVFLPTTRNSIKGIMKEIKRIREKVPDDPFEAELLMMAEMVAEDKKEDKVSSDSEPDASRPSSDVEGEPEAEGEPEGEGEEEEGGDAGGEEREFTPEPPETSNTFGEDIMQIALKMATELDEPSEDMENQLTPNTIQQPENADATSGETVKPARRGRKRAASTAKTPTKRNSSSETKKRKSHHNSETSSQPSLAIDEAKPDAKMKLKFTFGVNAWKSWVTQKNIEIEKLNSSAPKKLKPFKTDLLQLTTDELNFSLCLFVKEVRKPNGTSYAPDTIYYLCLGIQLYLFENGRIDNIFTDSYFETFTDALDEVAKKFSELFNDHHYIVTRVEEEHLWESKQLGAHSPHVLLSTLMFFNTKHFNLTNVEEHMLLSFSHIMKHWKRNQNQSGSSSGRAPGSRNVLLRFYPPQALVDDPNLRKKKVYEQHENEENPLRCPVKLYEFYLSKCPESVKNRNDVFYLQPERSCVPDSPVWYSTMALQKEPLEKMLNRVKMVKEINIALLVP